MARLSGSDKAFGLRQICITLAVIRHALSSKLDGRKEATRQAAYSYNLGLTLHKTLLTLLASFGGAAKHQGQPADW